MSLLILTLTTQQIRMNSLFALIPLALFLLVAVGLGFVGGRKKTVASTGGFVKEYFIANRSMGGFVLAMTTIATYGSVSSFVGGPGQAWSVGFGWVYMAVMQVSALILLYGIVGKKLALIARKLDAITIIDIVRARFGSDILATFSAVIVVAFFGATMVAQFVGGAKLFEAVTGYSYVVGLMGFGLAAIIFTSIGGFRGVALADTLCGIAMLVGIVVLAAGILGATGGYGAIMDSLMRNHPASLEPFAGGQMPPSLYVSQWILVGMLTFCLPQSLVRCMGFKNTAALHRAMIVGTVIIGAMMIGTSVLGVLCTGVLTDNLAAYGGQIDTIVPLTMVATLSPLFAGIAIIGPVAASISTVSSLLIASSSALVKDVAMHKMRARGKSMKPRWLVCTTQLTTLGIGVGVFVLAIVPPDVIWKINMFAFGGLETAFFCVMVGGLFWKRANKTGALCSMCLGTFAYCLSMALDIKLAGLHQIVIGLGVSIAAMILGSVVGQQSAQAQLEVFFPKNPHSQDSS